MVILRGQGERIKYPSLTFNSCGCEVDVLLMQCDAEKRLGGTSNPQVAGSSPAGCAIKINCLQESGELGYWHLTAW